MRAAVRSPRVAPHRIDVNAPTRAASTPATPRPTRWWLNVAGASGVVFQIDRGPTGPKVVSLRLFTGALAIRDRVDLGHGYAEKIAAAKVFGPLGGWLCPGRSQRWLGVEPGRAGCGRGGSRLPAGGGAGQSTGHASFTTSSRSTAAARHREVPATESAARGRGSDGPDQLPQGNHPSGGTHLGRGVTQPCVRLCQWGDFDRDEQSASESHDNFGAWQLSFAGIATGLATTGIIA